MCIFFEKKYYKNLTLLKTGVLLSCPKFEISRWSALLLDSQSGIFYATY